MVRHAKLCKKLQGFKLHKDAINEARHRFETIGVRIWVHRCREFPCVNDGIYHLTSTKPGGRWEKVLNQKLYNIYSEAERAGTGTAKQRRNKINRQKYKLRKWAPLEAWENEGGYVPNE